MSTLDAPRGQRGSDTRPSANVPDPSVVPAEDTNI
jgi:hypothetical protein